MRDGRRHSVHVPAVKWRNARTVRGYSAMGRLREAAHNYIDGHNALPATHSRALAAPNSLSMHTIGALLRIAHAW